MKHYLTFLGLKIEAPVDWIDITDTVDSPDSPFTLAKRDGVGALQFSPALYRGGPVANPTKDDLLSMAIEFGECRGLGDAFEAECFQAALTGASVSYHSEGDYIRVWYVSDQKNILLATYVCRWAFRDQELVECEEIIRALRFQDA